MPRRNFYIILTALLVYTLTAGVSLRDRLLVSTLHRIERDAYFEPSANALFEGAMSGMTDVLSEEHGDGYTMYIPPSSLAKYQEILDNRYEGLGFAVRLHEKEDEKNILIDYPHYNSPAYRAGLRAGDKIVQIDGTPVADKTLGEVLILLHQRPETLLSVVPFGQTESKEISIHRETIQSDSIEGDYFDSDKRFFCLESHPKIGYIRITSFSEHTAEQFRMALDSMNRSGAKSFILDLRDNGGGDVWQCIQIAQMLLAPDSKRNVIVTVRPRNGWERNITIPERTQRCTLPMAVLINGETASSSEILAAALQDHRRAVLIGTRSFGKGIIQGIIELPFQSGLLQLTDAEYRRPSGAVIHRKVNAADSDEWGIIPDKIVKLSEEEQSAVMQYRSLRSNVITTERQAVLDQFRQQIIDQLSGAKTDSDYKPFEFIGTVPYYDTQLDEAIKVLSEGELTMPLKNLPIPVMSNCI